MMPRDPRGRLLFESATRMLRCETVAFPCEADSRHQADGTEAEDRDTSHEGLPLGFWRSSHGWFEHDHKTDDKRFQGSGTDFYSMRTSEVVRDQCHG